MANSPFEPTFSSLSSVDAPISAKLSTGIPDLRPSCECKTRCGRKNAIVVFEDVIANGKILTPPIMAFCDQRSLFFLNDTRYAPAIPQSNPKAGDLHSRVESLEYSCRAVLGKACKSGGAARKDHDSLGVSKTTSASQPVTRVDELHLAIE